MFADRYLLPSLGHDVLAVIKGCGLPVDDVHVLKNIWPSSPRITGLKQLVLDLLIFRSCGAIFPDDVLKQLPSEFLIELIRRLSMRLPGILCAPCATTAAQRRQPDLKYDGLIIREGSEVAPFDNDMCIYHHHANDAERTVCKAREATKEKPKVH